MFEGNFLFRENDNGNFFFIVKSGELELLVKHNDQHDLQQQEVEAEQKEDHNQNQNQCQSQSQKQVKVFKTGDTFGELALLQKNKRTGTVRCIKDADIFCLEGSIFREIVSKLNRQDLNDRIYLLTLIPIFKGLSSVEVHNVANSMNKCYFKEEHVIISQGDHGESLYIISEGKVSCIKDGIVIRKLSSRDYFGESSILFETRRSLSIVAASSSVICYQVSKAVLQEALGQEFKQVLLKGICKQACQVDEYMKLLLFDQFYNCFFHHFHLCFYGTNETVISCKAETDKVVVVLEGSVINVTVFLFI